ncbi:MAG: hypothetical protein AB4426_33875 [Xenococcaceae cyanobacterium]
MAKTQDFLLLLLRPTQESGDFSNTLLDTFSPLCPPYKSRLSVKIRVIRVICVLFLTTEDEFGGQSQSHKFISHKYNPFCPPYKSRLSVKIRVIRVIRVLFLTTEGEFGWQSQSHNFISYNYNPFCPPYKS